MTHPLDGWFFTCAATGKRGYSSKRRAKAASKTLGGRGLSAYLCKAPGTEPHYHYGHLPRGVIAGTIPRADVYKPYEEGMT